jgi:hypothetical protein
VEPNTRQFSATSDDPDTTMSVRIINDSKSRVWVRPASDNNNLILNEYGDLTSYSSLLNVANDNFNAVHCHEGEGIPPNSEVCRHKTDSLRAAEAIWWRSSRHEELLHLACCDNSVFSIDNSPNRACSYSHPLNALHLLQVNLWIDWSRTKYILFSCESITGRCSTRITLSS